MTWHLRCQIVFGVAIVLFLGNEHLHKFIWYLTTTFYLFVSLQNDGDSVPNYNNIKLILKLFVFVKYLETRLWRNRAIKNWIVTNTAREPAKLTRRKRWKIELCLKLKRLKFEMILVQTLIEVTIYYLSTYSKNI